MKITKKRLKQIIAEEISTLSEVDNNQAQIATAQHLANVASAAKDQINQVNNSHDEDILERIYDLTQDINKLILGLDDGSKKGAIAGAADNLLSMVAEIAMENE
jgi:hypothetical protein